MNPTVPSPLPSDDPGKVNPFTRASHTKSPAKPEKTGQPKIGARTGKAVDGILPRKGDGNEPIPTRRPTSSTGNEKAPSADNTEKMAGAVRRKRKEGEPYLNAAQKAKVMGVATRNKRADGVTGSSRGTAEKAYQTLLGNKYEASMPKYEEMVNSLYEFAKTNETSTTKKIELFEKIDNATTDIQKLLGEKNFKEAKFLAGNISKVFESMEKNRPGTLSQWISANTTKSGDHIAGAYIPINRLALTLRDAGVANSIPEAIDSAAMDSMKEADLSILGLPHDGQIIPDDVLNVIVHTAVQRNRVEDSAGLRETSPKVSQQAANAFRGELVKQHISTPDQAIEYAKRYGQELKYIDISLIDFSETEKLEELITYLPNIKELIAADCNITEDSLKVLAHSRILEKITFLNLKYNQFGAEGIKVLADYKIENHEAFKHLEYLNLGECEITNEGMEKLANSGILRNVKSLYLSDNFIENAGIKALVESKPEKLEKLYLHNNELGNEGAKTLADSEIMKNIKILNLNRNHIGVEGMKAWADSKIEKFENLEILNLNFNKLENEGVKILGDSGILKNVKTLTLNSNNIDDEAIKNLVSSGTMKNVEVFSASRIKDDGIIAIAENLENLKNLKTLKFALNLSTQPLTTEEGIKALELIKEKGITLT